MLPLILMVLLVCVTTTARSALRWTVVVAVLELLPPLGSMTEADEIFPVSLKVLLADAPKAAVGKLPWMVMVCAPAAVVKLAKANAAPVASHVVTSGAQVTVAIENPAGKVLLTVTFRASFGPLFVTVNV